MSHQLLDGKVHGAAPEFAGFLAGEDMAIPFGDADDALDLSRPGDSGAVGAFALEGQTGGGEELSPIDAAGDEDASVGGGGVAQTVQGHGWHVDHLARYGEGPVDAGSSLGGELGCSFEDEEGLLIGMTMGRYHDAGRQGGF